MFDDKTAYVGEDWKADETLEALAKEGIEAIAVAIPNGLKRADGRVQPVARERDVEGPAAVGDARDGWQGRRLPRWVVGTVMPLVDRSFPTAAGPAHTAMIGSSMGGLISLYALAARAASLRPGGRIQPIGDLEQLPHLRRPARTERRVRRRAALRRCRRQGGSRHDERCAQAAQACCSTSALPRVTTCSTSRTAKASTARPRGPNGCPPRCASCWRRLVQPSDGRG